MNELVNEINKKNIILNQNESNLIDENEQKQNEILIAYKDNQENKNNKSQ